jgi:GNAT superfamily N-acetyltransferase
MYIPPQFRVEQDAAWDIVKEAGAGLLVVSGLEGMESVFVPVVVSEDRSKLTSHVAKANKWWRTLNDGDEVLAIFLAASAYVSPSLYPSRFEKPGVVPTWNFVMAEVRGTVTVHSTGGFNTDFPNTFWLFGMFVSPKARGSGVGIDLVVAVEEWAKRQGGDELYLHVTETMQRARAFYTKIGFTLNGGSVTMDRDPLIQLVTMVKKLG